MENNPLRYYDPTGLSLADFDIINPGQNAGYADGQLVGYYKNISIYGSGGNYDTTWQCNEFVQRFMNTYWGTDIQYPLANGQDYNGDMLHKKIGGNYVTSYNNAPGNTLPREDQIITFGASTLIPEGHVAVVADVSYNPSSNSGAVVIAQQHTKQAQVTLSLTRNQNGSYNVGSFASMPALSWTGPAATTPTRNIAPVSVNESQSASVPTPSSSIFSRLWQNISRYLFHF